MLLVRPNIVATDRYRVFPQQAETNLRGDEMKCVAYAGSIATCDSNLHE